MGAHGLSSRTCWTWSLAVLGALQPEPGPYLELPGMRCAERVDVYPLGHVGGMWTDFLHTSAVDNCTSDSSCAGFMRYMGTNPVHCYYWCGRPQLCDAGGEVELNDMWLSYVKVDHLAPSGLPKPQKAPRRLECSGVGRVSMTDVLLMFEPGNLQDSSAPGTCRVLHRPYGSPSLVTTMGAKPIESLALYDGLLLEGEDDELSYFSALRSDHGPWRYFVDTHDYPAPTLGAPGPKRHFMSVYFLSQEAACPGPGSTIVTFADALDVLPKHTYVDDGTHETRRAAFEEYQLTILCGDFSRVPFPPAALVYSLAYASHPIVPKTLYGNLSRAFFHLQDAAQPFKNVNIEKFQQILEDLFSDPAKEEAVHFKQTFMFLGQQLFFYKYRETAEQRLEAAACTLCESRERERQRNSAVQVRGPGTETVAAAFCSMSRRSSHKLRQVVRETWGQIISSMPSAALRFFVGHSNEPLHDREGIDDVVELPVVESYRTINVKAFLMLTWAFDSYPHLEWLVRHDDDIYLRPLPLLAMLDRRPALRYLWGNFDHGSTPVRDPEHIHYNSYTQCPERQHPVWGDIFPPYARGHLWAMSADLLGEIVKRWKQDVEEWPTGLFTEAIASQLTHPDDPAIGVVIFSLVSEGLAVNLDDRDFNKFSLNPSCNSTFSNIHRRTWVVHHVNTETMRCMWSLDEPSKGALRFFPDLCPCSTHVEEEEDLMYNGVPFTYDRERFNDVDE